MKTKKKTMKMIRNLLNANNSYYKSMSLIGNCHNYADLQIWLKIDNFRSNPDVKLHFV